MIIVGLVLVGLVVVLVRHRAGRKSTLAGLNSDRPQFLIDPPRRRVSPLKGERL